MLSWTYHFPLPYVLSSHAANDCRWSKTTVQKPETISPLSERTFAVAFTARKQFQDSRVLWTETLRLLTLKNYRDKCDIACSQSSTKGQDGNTKEQILKSAWVKIPSQLFIVIRASLVLYSYKKKIKIPLGKTRTVSEKPTNGKVAVTINRFLSFHIL